MGFRSKHANALPHKIRCEQAACAADPKLNKPKALGSPKLCHTDSMGLNFYS
jgi:hypothetical protein